MSLITRALIAQFKGDKIIWLIVAILSLYSLLAVYSSTESLAYRYYKGDTEAYFFRHAILLLSGIVLMYFCHLVNYMHYAKFALWGVIASAILLFITLAFGVDINDAKRWISIPFVGISFQTSDLAKPMLIIYVAYMLAKTKDNLADFQKAYLPTILPVLLICGLIAPADLTTAIVLFLSCLILMFIGRTEVRYVLYTILFGIALFSLLVVIGDMFPDFVRVNTWTTRLNEFISNKEGGYQVQQAKVAIANGGWLGVGPSNGFQSAMIPSSHSDFIFAIILEEFGLLGAGVLIGMYMWLFMRCIRIITRSPKAFGSMLALGLALLIVIQAFINMSISVHLIPVGGVPLPLVSMGGTSTMFTCVMFGVILSVSRYIEMDKIGA